MLSPTFEAQATFKFLETLLKLSIIQLLSSGEPIPLWCQVGVRLRCSETENRVKMERKGRACPGERPAGNRWLHRRHGINAWFPPVMTLSHIFLFSGTASSGTFQFLRGLALVPVGGQERRQHLLPFPLGQFQIFLEPPEGFGGFKRDAPGREVDEHSLHQIL